jgi:hypothetical protein
MIDWLSRYDGLQEAKMIEKLEIKTPENPKKKRNQKDQSPFGTIVTFCHRFMKGQSRRFGEFSALPDRGLFRRVGLAALDQASQAWDALPS